MRLIRYTSIQRFCLHDGPGIRTTAFLKGCNLHCPWCCNPENIDPDNDWPTFEARPEELVAELLKDRAFFGEEGGVTWSGGEPLLQSEAIVPAMRMLREQGVHQAVETALFIPRTMLERVLELIDLFIVDAKVFDSESCREIVGGNLNLYLSNIDVLSSFGARIIIRVPLIYDYTTADDNINNIVKNIKDINTESVELLFGHNLGSDKYRSLGLAGYETPPLDRKHVNRIRSLFVDSGINAAVVS